MTDLQFINLEGPRDHSKPQIRAFVRGHVMKRFHNQRRAKLRLQSRQENESPHQVDARLLHTVPTSSAEDILQLSRSGEFSPRQVPQAFAPVSYTHKRKRYTTSPVSALEAGYDDPFTSLPIQMDPYKSYLIHHYSSFVTPVIFPFVKWRASNPMRAKFLPLCITSPALLKAVLVAASTNLVHCGLHDSRIVAICRGGAIRLINDALQDKYRAVEDATIAAVVHLAFAELMNGDLASWEVHMKGLEKMIEMKGGPQSLGLDGLMHHIIYSIDYCGATMNQTNPRFTPLREPLTSIPQLLFQGCPYVAIGPGIRTLANSSSISKELVNILEDMSYLTTFLELPSQSSTMTQQMRYFDALSLIEHRILSVPMGNDTQYGAFNGGNIDETCRLAALIYINRVFRELQLTSAVHATLANRLRILLMQTDFKSCWGTLSEALLWVLFIGSSVAMQEPTKSWLMFALENVCSHLKLQSWCNARDILSKYLWCDRIWEERCKSIWGYVNLRKQHLTVLS